ncbi:MAG: EF-P lysine aminoacylase GenX [Deltaproteobacteria bacterium CG2_30_63_29]|nr:MAG: EF-P lysine aminoacylase GenX [Deltaproteobacteria bacterium CG2_30_63_29]
MSPSNPLVHPSLNTLRQRARAIREVHRFFTERGYLSVETPQLRAWASMEPHLDSFRCEQVYPDGRVRPVYLHTSPEYAMKGVLALHGVPIYQLATVFRNNEGSRTHNAEFSLIEWYRPGEDYNYLMNETEALVMALAATFSPGRAASWAEHEVPWLAPFERLTVEEAFRRHTGLSLSELGELSDFCAAVQALGYNVDASWTWDDLFHLVVLEHIEPHLGAERPTFLCDYPARLASLARLKPSDARFAERFELYVGGLELCNGFSELVDQAEQRKRFEAEQQERSRLGKEVLDLDPTLLSALEALGDCTGNALGFDRLMMLLLGLSQIEEVRVT